MKYCTIALGALSFFLSGLVFGQNPIVIQFSHVVAPDTPKGQAAEHFKKLAEERTQGRVRVDIYPNSQLYKDKEEVEALQLGAVQMLAPSLSKFGPMGVHDFEVFELPYLFKDYNDVHKLTRGPLGRAMLDKLQSKGIIGLAYWDNGFRQMTANKPIREPKDFKGLRMRIVSAKVTDAYMRAMGAMPQVMAFSEVYQAMQSGVVDGGENALSNIYTQKFFEVQKYLTISDHGYLGYAVIVNKKFWDSLPDDIRKILAQAMVEATEHNDIRAEKDNQDALDSIKKSAKTEITVLTSQEKAVWKAKMLPVHQQMESRIGREAIQAAHKVVGFKPE